MNNSKVVVLLSAGLDSTTNLFLAVKKNQEIQTVTFNYGQRAAEQEIAKSREISAYLKVPHTVIELPWLKKISHSSLTNENYKIPTGAAVSIDDLAISTISAQSVWVPNRNGVFLNIAASLAEATGAGQIVPGFNLEEAKTFPDNSEEFMKISTEAFKYSTKNQVQVVCYTAHMNKVEIMQTAVAEKVPLNFLWPCYFNGKKWCGQCESCRRTERAMRSNHIDTEKYFSSKD